MSALPKTANKILCHCLFCFSYKCRGNLAHYFINLPSSLSNFCSCFYQWMTKETVYGWMGVVRFTFRSISRSRAVSQKITSAYAWKVNFKRYSLRVIGFLFYFKNVFVYRNIKNISSYVLNFLKSRHSIFIVKIYLQGFFVCVCLFVLLYKVIRR